MIKNERQREILALLNENGFVTVKKLGEHLFASESSIRRDLTDLENRGIIKRNYGGAELISVSTNVLPFNTRTYSNANEKQVIAKKASALVKDGDVIFLDQSSTSYFLARELCDRKNLTVVTNNIEIINCLSQTRVKVICSGGELSADNRMCFIGANAQRAFEEINADMLFFSAKSLSESGVISDCTQEEVFVRNSMLRNAKKVVFLCNSEKFSTVSPYNQCTLKDVDMFITELSKLPDQYIEYSHKTI